MSIVLSPASSAKQETSAPLRWIYNAPADLIFGCGVWSLPLLLVTTFLDARFKTQLAFVFYALALALNYPHYMATIYRAYHRKSDALRYRTFTVHLTGGLVLALLLTHAFPTLLPWVFTTYIFWSPWHYTGQNYGIAMMFAKRNGIAFTPALRTIFYGAFELSYIILLIGFNIGPSSDRFVFSLGLPTQTGRVAMGVALALFTLAAAWSVFQIARQSGVRRAAPTLLPLATQCIWFFPILTVFKSESPVFHIQYSVGALAILHSTQYLWITSFYARSETQAEKSGKRRRTFQYFGTLFIGGIALFVPGPWLTSYAFKFDFTTSFLIFTALVNIHHFILDGAVWKLRDARVARLLIGDNAKSELAEETPHTNHMQSLWQKVVFAPAAVTLLALATLDQMRFFLGANPSYPLRLARAESLNPYDSRIHMRIAGAETAAGNQTRAQAALQRAIAVNPYDFESQSLLGKMLIEKRDYDLAYVHYRRILSYFPSDVDSLVNFGLLASRLNNAAEAISSWERAVRIDPRQQNALLYLGEAHAHAGRHADSAAYLERALVLFPQDATRPEYSPTQFLTLILKIGDEYAQLSDATKADGYYARAVAFAGQAKLKDLETTALSRHAELLASTGQIAQATQAYQNLLKLDAELGDQKATAADWHNYGSFLARTNAPTELAYACCLTAEELLIDDVSNDALKPIRELRESLEVKLKLKAQEVRRERATFTKRACEWKPSA